MSAQNFGESYYAAVPSISESTREARLIQDVLKRVDPDLEARVQATYQRWNLKIRSFLRDETALRLSVGDDRMSVPVRVVPGLPPPFEALVQRYPDPIMWELLLQRPLLERTGEGLQYLTDRFPDLLTRSAFDPPAASWHDLNRSREFVLQALSLLEGQEISKSLNEINEDLLGAYYFNEPRIELYWMVIGLVAGMLGVRAEELTTVVLAHELSHAYTHLGLDIDHQRWDTDAFASADLHIVEGLAQWYTAAFCDAARYTVPGALDAFQKLLSIQPSPYSVFYNEQFSSEREGEIIRSGMLLTRKNGITKFETFYDEVESARKRLRKQATPPGYHAGYRPSGT